MVTDPAAPQITPEDAVYDLDADLIGNVVLVLAEGRAGHVRDLIQPLHYADVADLLERLSPEERTALHDIIGDDFEADILSELDDTVRDEIIDNMDPTTWPPRSPAWRATTPSASSRTWKPKNNNRFWTPFRSPTGPSSRKGWPTPTTAPGASCSAKW
jgi:hypothetical protein